LPAAASLHAEPGAVSADYGSVKFFLKSKKIEKISFFSPPGTLFRRRFLLRRVSEGSAGDALPSGKNVAGKFATSYQSTRYLASRSAPTPFQGSEKAALQCEI
jgi:hypothetical protein